MKNLKNVEFDLEGIDKKASYFDLIIQAVNTPGKDGLGDLNTQMMRMTILKKVKEAQVKKDVDHVDLEDAEAIALVEFQENVRYAILDENLINYQKLIKNLI